jgi:hypothetical protein
MEDERVAELIGKTPETRPVGSTHWSCRTMAKEIVISKSSGQRVWNVFGCVDEKSQCQALERSQPMLPMGLGYVEGVIDQFVAAYNQDCTPFIWHATAESIFEKISCLYERISGTVH